MARIDSKDNRNSSGITKLVTGRANFGYPGVKRTEKCAHGSRRTQLVDEFVHRVHRQYSQMAIGISIIPLTPNDHYSGRTAPLTSKRCILYIYSTNIGTEYFKHGIYSQFFFLNSKCSLFHNSNVFGFCIIHILYTCALKFKKKIIPAPKG